MQGGKADESQANNDSMAKESNMARESLDTKFEETLETVTAKWKSIDRASPFLITEQIANRTTLIYQKIKILLKQRDEPIPSGPTYWG